MFFENLGVHWDSNSQSGSSLWECEGSFLTLSYTPESMRCDSQASFFVHNLASPCIGREPKARVVTNFASSKFGPLLICPPVFPLLLVVVALLTTLGF